MEKCQLIWIGAGDATLPFFELGDFDKVCFVDARENAIERLKVKYSGNSTIRSINYAISVNSGTANFSMVRPESFSQLDSIDEARELFPSISLVEEFEVKTITLSVLFEEIAHENDSITLVLDVPSFDERVARQAMELSTRFNITNLYIYDGNRALVENNEFGFKFVGRVKGDASGNYAQYCRDLSVSLLEKELSQVTKINDEKVRGLESDLEQTRVALSSNLATNTTIQKQEFSTLNEKLGEIFERIAPLSNGQLTDALSNLQAKNQLNSNTLNEFFDSVKEEFETFLTDIEEKSKDNELQVRQNDLIGDALTEIRTISEKLSKLETEVKTLSDKQQEVRENKNDTDVNRVLRNLPFLLQKNSYNTSKQIESFISLNKYINHHEIPLSFHGWPISPDIGLALIDYIENRNVDVVIEFGSGTSSVLFAKAFKLANSDSNLWSLEQPIISFEHNEEYVEKTSQLLKSHECRSLVDLIHAPLVDFHYSTEEKFLYYDCEESIKSLSSLLGNDKKNILILIDGPPGVTNKNARFPALPILLNHMSKHRLIVVMDDYDRDDERETFKLWEELAKKRSLTHNGKFIETEKGLAILTIN